MDEVLIHKNKGNTGYSRNDVNEIFTSNMETLGNKIEKLINENTLLKQEVESLRTGVDFQNKWFEEAKRNFEEIRAIIN